MAETPLRGTDPAPRIFHVRPLPKDFSNKLNHTMTDYLTKPMFSNMDVMPTFCDVPLAAPSPNL